MQQQDVEPVIFVLRHVHPHPIAPQLEVHPCILHIPDPIQPKVRVPFSQQYRLNGDAVWFGGVGICIREREVDFADIVDETRDGEHVEGTERALGACTLWIVVVTVNGEDRDTDVEVGVLVVDRWEAGKL